MREPVLEEVNIPETELNRKAGSDSRLSYSPDTNVSKQLPTPDSFTPLRTQGSFVLKVFPDQVGLKRMF